MSKLLHATCPKVKWCLILLRTHYPCLFPLWKMSINPWNEYILQTEEVQITFANLHGTWQGHKRLKGAPPFLKSPFLGHPTAYRRLSHSVKVEFSKAFSNIPGTYTSLHADQKNSPVCWMVLMVPLSMGFPLATSNMLGQLKGRNLLHLWQKFSQDSTEWGKLVL